MKIITNQRINSEINIPQLVDLIYRSFQENLEKGVVSLGSRMTVPMFLERFGSDVLILARDDNKKYAGVMIISGEKDGYLELIAVAPEYKRSGVGRQMLAQGEKLILERGGSFFGSDTSVRMRSSVKWHLQNGFRRYALTSYPSTDYYSIIFRKSLKSKKKGAVLWKLRFLLSAVYSGLTKRTGRIALPENKLSLREIQQVSTDILSKVHNFCIHNNIKYTLAYGSLIGAIRHKGFIPWDDDIDIIMPRPDYDRFLATFQEPGLAVMSSYDPDSYILYSHVCDLSRTFVRTTLPFSKQCQGGVWIDIFPADAVSDRFEDFAARIPHLIDLFKKQIYFREAKVPFKDMPTVKKIMGLAIRKLIRKNGKGLQEANREMETIISAIPWGTTNHWSQMACMDEGEKMYQLLEDFETCVPVTFEGKQFMAMKGYDRTLRMIFGDYMKLPPEEERAPHNSFVRFYWIR